MLSVLIMTMALSAPTPVAQPPKKSRTAVATKTTKVVKSAKSAKTQPKVVTKASGRKIHIFHKAKRLSTKYVRTGRRHRVRLFG